PILIVLLALPTAQPLPATCADPCTITAMVEAYVLPANVIADNSTVDFVSGDIGHVTADGISGSTCFSVSQGPGNPSPGIRFYISGGQLRANYSDGSGSHDNACTSAVALPDGSFVLPFYCRLHPNMRGALVVSA